MLNTASFGFFQRIWPKYEAFGHFLHYLTIYSILSSWYILVTLRQKYRHPTTHTFGTTFLSLDLVHSDSFWMFSQTPNNNSISFSRHILVTLRQKIRHPTSPTFVTNFLILSTVHSDIFWHFIQHQTIFYSFSWYLLVTLRHKFRHPKTHTFETIFYPFTLYTMTVFGHFLQHQTIFLFQFIPLSHLETKV